jgi:hypothetical protein
VALVFRLACPRTIRDFTLLSLKSRLCLHFLTSLISCKPGCDSPSLKVCSGILSLDEFLNFL